MNLSNVKLGHSPLTDEIYLFRHGKNPMMALDKGNAERDVFTVLIYHMMHDCPQGSERTVTLGDRRYLIRVVPEDGA